MIIMVTIMIDVDRISANPMIAIMIAEINRTDAIIMLAIMIVDADMTSVNIILAIMIAAAKRKNVSRSTAKPFASISIMKNAKMATE
ncbi:hypothetical protein A361_03440 [Cytobacillus oceanisediminis 2691]|uniref:Uncharacterized protein n=4 Tax=Bacillaceae TaxID=186817 RepID=A0A160M7L2_9BACI|nr:hypothetical protein [Cytobacillus oceanisediminis]AND38213.1 hypothetical protein A361_03440 [Cytobacillus oceanisediminis 2691]MBU8731102.1 hypothetical protein [Cytobacillus oceanisediminis]OHX48114.1 hypothetical protein BBV17_18590 [Cytobacillus oceanisediminis]QOK29841.1 hypothetical protein IIE26_24965 [Cytobacillus oceanisediminis]